MYAIITVYTGQAPTEPDMLPELDGIVTPKGDAPDQIADAADAAYDIFRAAVKQGEKHPDAFGVFCFADDQPAFYHILYR